MIVGEKLMVFHASGVDNNTVTSHDSGTDIDLCALPASAITSVFAEEDQVYVYFKEAGRFELGIGTDLDSNDTDAEVLKTMEQTFVRLTVAEGKEIDVVKDFAALATMVGSTTNPVPVFDAVNSVYPINNITGIQIRRHLTGHAIL
tara:strand:+ start:55 stop:492 length:438 start_codon:yes stop_codon:yes gene_type:complete